MGVGFLTFHPSVSMFSQTAIPLVVKYKPAAVWLFAPDPNTNIHREIIKTLHDVGVSWNIKIFVQVGSVAGARDAINDGADAIVVQGIDSTLR